MKKFNIPNIYRSPVITRIKEYRKLNDLRKKDCSPTLLDCGPIRFLIARHFGFCYGVENAIEISNKIIEKNPDRRIFLLSEIIHNPTVNEELLSRGVKFLMDTTGQQLIGWNELQKEDIVIIPAFGTTLEVENLLINKGIDVKKYNTTCPFVEKVWNRSEQLGKDKYTVVIHGKHYHEETRATFSHTIINAPSVIVRNIEETKILGKIISSELNGEEFYKFFAEKHSSGFDVEKDLTRIGVVNQTTMLAAETQEIADYLKSVLIEKYGRRFLKDHYADTRDTLCYATNDNQEATYGLLKEDADFAVVVGGYNSSNTSHIVELCEEKIPTYFISGPDKIISKEKVNHFDIKQKKELSTSNYIKNELPVTVMLTSGASCPDALVESTLIKLTSFFDDAKDIDEVMESFNIQN